MFLAYHNFCWRTREVKEGRNRLPAAVAAGTVDTLRTFEELLDRVMGTRYAAASHPNGGIQSPKNVIDKASG